MGWWLRLMRLRWNPAEKQWQQGSHDIPEYVIYAWLLITLVGIGGLLFVAGLFLFGER